MAKGLKKIAGYLGLVDDEADFETTVALEIPQKSVRVTPPATAVRVAEAAPIRTRVAPASVAPATSLGPLAKPYTGFAWGDVDRVDIPDATRRMAW